jgi:uncharacterized protein (DUF362 family)
MRRRELLMTPVAAAAAIGRAAERAPLKLGMPGPYRGRVVEVSHPAVLRAGMYQPGPVQQMMRKGMTDLTGAQDWVEAWSTFFKPGDVVGIKVNPWGANSAPTVITEILSGLKEAGVRPGDIVLYDRYKTAIDLAGWAKSLPGVRLSWAAPAYDDVQLGMDGYDGAHYAELPVLKVGWNTGDPHARRSYAARFLTREVQKVINVPVLKYHRAAGVTLALKNMAYGMANNVKRSHQVPTINAVGMLIPAIADMPVFRQKVVLNILDGVRGYFGGKGTWAHRTLYFATDPVALDKTAGRAVDAKRVEMGLPPVALVRQTDPNEYLNLAPEHIEIASRLGLGEFDDAKIDLKKLQLS